MAAALRGSRPIVKLCSVVRLAPVAAVVAVLGCAGDVDLSPSEADPPGGSVGVARPGGDAGVDGGGRLDASPGVPAVRFALPEDGARYARDGVAGWEWAAPVEVELEASAVASIDLTVDDVIFATLDAPPWQTRIDVPWEGLLTLSAVGRDVAGTEVARDTIMVTVDPPTDPSCHSMLDALGLDWTPASPTEGIADPVRVEPYFPTSRGDVRYRYVSRADPTTLLMDCELAPRLSALAEVVASYGLDEVIHIGIYNYRCIGGGDPSTGCTPSQHAYARAIDLHAFADTSTGTVYSTELDWEITGEPICPASAPTEADRVLRELACTMYDTGMFHIILTPEYNDAHRNHFHVDLTDDSMFIGLLSGGLDPPRSGLGH